MAAKYLMSWDPTPRRWQKMVNGTLYKVSVRQLSKFFDTPIPETKEGSYQWANRWWRDRAAKLELAIDEPVHPHADRLALLRDKQDWARRHGEPGVAEAIASEIAGVEGADERHEPGEDLDAATLDSVRLFEMVSGVRLDLGKIDSEFIRHFFGDRRVWQERFKRGEPGEPLPEDRTLAGQVSRYLEIQRTRCEAKQVSVSEYSNCRAGLTAFRDWVGDIAIDAIDADTLEGWWLHLLGSSLAIDTRRKHLRYARNLLAWLTDKGMMPALGNLSRRYRFKGERQAIPATDPRKVAEAIAKSKGQLRLHLLLMANCGFTQRDIADLADSEVDWAYGRIRRKRSKTHTHKQVPVVDYLLWDETWRLLREYRSGTPIVLLTATGKRWLRDAIGDGGKRSRTDAIKSLYRHLGADISPNRFRKCSSTLLDGSAEHGRYAIHFLGHAPDIAHKHYIHANGAGFDAAIRWLAGQYGLTPR